MEYDFTDWRQIEEVKTYGETCSIYTWGDHFKIYESMGGTVYVLRSDGRVYVLNNDYVIYTVYR